MTIRARIPTRPPFQGVGNRFADSSGRIEAAGSSRWPTFGSPGRSWTAGRDGHGIRAPSWPSPPHPGKLDTDLQITTTRAARPARRLGRSVPGVVSSRWPGYTRVSSGSGPNTCSSRSLMSGFGRAQQDASFRSTCGLSGPRRRSTGTHLIIRAPCFAGPECTRGVGPAGSLSAYPPRAPQAHCPRITTRAARVTGVVGPLTGWPATGTGPAARCRSARSWDYVLAVRPRRARVAAGQAPGLARELRRRHARRAHRAFRAECGPYCSGRWQIEP